MEFLFIPYFHLVTRLIFFFLHDDFFLLRHFNRFLGKVELFLGWVRDFSMIPYTLYLFGNHLYVFFKLGDFSWPLELILLSLSIYARWWRWRGLAPLQELARLHPRIHPQEFMNHLYARLGFLPHRIPKKANRVIDPTHLDFRSKEEARQSFPILLHGVYDTFLFATLAYKAFRWKGAYYIKTAGSGLSLVWASRIAQIGKMEVLVERPLGTKAIHEGKLIYAVNHKSFFDFCLAPLAYRKENADGSAASFIPRIMVAKDHFKDNFFLYKVVGFGQMLEAWGMVFVDRKSKRPGKAQESVHLTVKKLLASDMVFSIYPQGTRARGQCDRDGSRWDAGYFCVGKRDRLKKEGGHFKKGVAYVACETALTLYRHQLGGNVWIIPISMDGVGTACPKGSLKVQTEAKVVIKVGDPIRLDPQEMRSLKALTYQAAYEHPFYRQKVEELVRQIDHSLQELLGVATRLERRFFTDLRDILDARGIDEVAVALKQWRVQGDLVYVILDCVYCLPMKNWRGFLMELANLLRHECTKEDLESLRTKIADCF